MALALALLTPGLALPQTSVTDSAPDVAALIAHVADAGGPVPKAGSSVTTFTRGGLQGTRVLLRSGEDWIETVQFGPFTTATGTYRGLAWFQNENGQTVIDRQDPGDAEADATTSSVARIAKPFAAFVISKLDARGNGTKSYVDPATWRIVREDSVRAGGTTVTLYDDFRSSNGYTRAWHWTIRDGHPEDDEDDQITSDSGGDFAPAALAIPPSRRNLVEFPPGVSQVSLPARQDGGWFIVRVTVGTRGLDFLLDTGSSGITIDEDVARQLALKTYAPESEGEGAGRFTDARSIVPEMHVGSLTMHDVVVDTLPHFPADYPEYKIVGILGFDFIASLALKLDYENGRLTAYDRAAFAPPADPLTNVLDIRLGSGTPRTSVTINGSLGERFLIDTGAHRYGVIIFDYFSRKHPGAVVNEPGAAAVDQIRAYGVGGGFELQPYLLKSVRLGVADFRDFYAFAVTSKSAFTLDQDGIIGTAFLRLFDVYIDYFNSRIYLVPTERTRKSLKR